MAQRGKSISISTGILPPNQRTNSPGKTDGRRESDVKPAAGGRRGSVFGGGPLKSNTIKGGVLSNSQSNADSTLPELPTKAIIDSLPIMARGINTAELHEKGGGKYFSISDLTMIHRKASKIHVPKMDNMSSFMRNKNRESLVEKRKSLLTESISEETSTAKDAPHRKSISSFTPTKEYPKLANSIQQSLKGMTKSLEDKIDVLIEKGPLNDAALDLLIELEAKYESRINSPEMHRPEIEPGTRPKVLAEQRFEIAKDEYLEKISVADDQAKKLSCDLIQGFKDVFAERLQDLSSSISTLVKPDILSALCKQEIDEYFAKEAQVYEAQVDSINKLEKYLEQSEMDRVSQIGSSLLEFGRAVYKIKFESPSSVTRMVQDEAVSINLASIKNREDIVQFCSAFMAMNEENHEASVGTLKVIYKKWQDSRFNALYELFIDDIKRAANKDVRNHYKKYQAIFDEYLKRQVELLNSVVSVPFSKISLEWIKEWEHKCKDILGAHQESITLFKRDVQSFDDDLEKHGRAVFDQYLPSLEECDLYEKKKLTEKMNDEWLKHKKSEDIIAGKRCAIVLPSQLSRNNDILLLVSDLLTCLLSMREDAKNNVTLVETETQNNLIACHNATISYYKQVEEFLKKEMNGMKKDEDEGSILLRKTRSNEKLKAVEESQKAFYAIELGVVNSLEEKMVKVFDLYKFRLASFLGNTITDANGKAIINVENELEFLARKILEYYNVPAPTLPQVNKPTVGNNIKKDKAALAAAAATSSATATTSATAVPNNSEESNISAPGAVENQEETTTPAPAVSFEVEASLATAAAVQPATSGSKQQKTPSSPSKRSNPELDKSLTKFNKSSNNASHSQTSGVKDGEDNIMKTDMAIIEALRTAVSSRSENLKTSGDLKLVTTPVSRPMTIDRASSALIHVANTRAAEQQQQHHHHAEHPKTPEDAAAAPTPPNSVTISNDVIEVRAIPLATLTNFRIKLQTRLFEYFEQYRSETMAFIQKKTVEGKAILRDESSTALFTMEVWYREIDEVSKRQHEHVKNLRATIEVQVRVIEHRMEQVQTAYSRCIADAEYLATQLLEQGVAGSIIPRINDCKTSHSLKKLVTETENMRNLTLDEIDIMLKDADDRFLKEIAVLEEARTVGTPWHPFAWNIVSQKMSAIINSMVGANAVSASADPLVSVSKWKDTLAERIQRCKLSITEGTNAGISELLAHLRDVELIEGVGRQVQSMRLKIKAEKFAAGNAQKLIQTTILELSGARDDEKMTWERVAVVVNAGEKVRKALVEYCNYLDCVKQGRENCILDINFNTFDTWRRYKERVGWMYCGRKDYSQQSFHSLASSSNLVSAKSKQGLTSKPVANTTSSSQSTSAIFSSQSKKNFLSMSKSNLLKSSNAISIPAAQPNRPSSARSEVNLINNNTTTKSINNTGPNNAAFSSVPLSESLQRLADLARFSSLVSDSFRDSREKAMTIAEAYYKDRAVTSIKRFEDIPDTLNAFMSKTDKEFDTLRKEAETTRRVWVEECILTVNNTLQELLSSFRKCYIHVLHEHLNDLETSWRSKTSWYARQSEHLRLARRELERLLKSRMGHPIFSDELNDLNAASVDRDVKLAAVMKELETSLSSDMGYLGFDFVQKMEYSTDLFSSLLNVTLLETDIEKYVEPQIAYQIPIKQLLLERQQLTKDSKYHHHHNHNGNQALLSTDENADVVSIQRPNSSSGPPPPKKLASLASIKSEKDLTMEGTAPVAEATSAILDNYTLNKQESKASNMNSKPGSAKSQTSSSLPEAGEEADDDQTMVIKALDVSLLPIKKWGEEKIQSDVLECRKTSHHRMLVEMRDEVMSAFASELTRKYKLLQEQLDRDSKIEGEWKQVWVESLQKIQKIYI